VSIAAREVEEVWPLVYVVGRIAYDFSSEPRRDFFVHDADDPLVDRENILPYLQDHPEAAAALTWTVNVGDFPLYAIAPAGPFAETAYERLRGAFGAQVMGELECVAVAGVIAGTARLLTGHRVPVIVPDLLGLAGWPTSSRFSTETRNLIERIAGELRNQGRSAKDRAMNFAATEILEHVVEENVAAGRTLDAIGAVPTPICRPGSDCWDVQLTFSKVTYVLTVDVSDVVPVPVGEVGRRKVG
jgi:hypothetical protein